MLPGRGPDGGPAPDDVEGTAAAAAALEVAGGKAHPLALLPLPSPVLNQALNTGRGAADDAAVVSDWL